MSSELDLRMLIGHHPDSDALKVFLGDLQAKTGASVSPDVKAYSDAVYYNHYALGISLMFAPEKGYNPAKSSPISPEKLSLDSIDLYNVPSSSQQTNKATSSRTAEVKFSTYPVNPFTLHLTPALKDKEGTELQRPATFQVSPATTGKGFVAAFGEPDRKGGGAGPTNGSIGIWCEWSRDGVMVEFAGSEARGPQAWERGKDALWRVITIFAPKT
ncbi:uncharacterized protein SCHCODRAFT_02611888 [Schizophyllum commune H4-8]|uniref:Uncharacterized protein n=1 Tax=Schizophyllum commune (strain H4-8 / FGSC 9210) TaxID=578458 RepID=D8PPN3_SCHCM|nr:uncharacterized protein SCHCODRAFT_02611888 [Schizophyllum commune H4-8]KAI5898372.1 hypothetical protein SCHCODRAFT_02611888 [Schizophyllum commune H4-8]